MSSEFAWALGIAGATALASVLWKRIKHPDEFPQMKWIDWCGHFALIGIAMVLIFGLLGFDILRNAGMLMVFSLYPIAILGLLGRFDEMFGELIRAIRRR